ncbi:MAG: hypothetical protein ACFFD1_09705 [Candidatus Thorarchaeota archaeon]
MSTSIEYQAGYCNIGSEEKRLRRRAGYFGLIISLIGILLILFLKIDPIFSILLFFPIYLTVIGFYQAKSNFCVYFGFSGLYDMEEKAREIRKVQDDIKRKTDRKKALKMSLIALMITIISTLIIFGIVYELNILNL